MCSAMRRSVGIEIDRKKIMKARNRMADVVKLRSNVCQEFLKMILKNNWKAELYNVAKQKIDENNSYAFKYYAAYEKMREEGIDSFEVGDMDVSLIYELVASQFPGINPIKKETFLALKQVKGDRNTKDHSSDNEDDEEIYLCGLLDLCDLRTFVRTVDDKEKTIQDKDRRAFRQKNIRKIETLKNLLDEERIELLHACNDIDEDIQKILDSPDQPKTWIEICGLYMKRASVSGKQKELELFFQRASDAGIRFAHLYVTMYAAEKRDYKEYVKRALMHLETCTELHKNDVFHFVIDINNFIKEDNKLSKREEILHIVDEINKKGFDIMIGDDGLLKLN